MYLFKIVEKLVFDYDLWNVPYFKKVFKEVTFHNYISIGAWILFECDHIIGIHDYRPIELIKLFIRR